MAARYDTIGTGYAKRRVADPRWAAQIRAAIGPAERVLNVGAGTGNYEPEDCMVTALEPSALMIKQRTSAAPTLQGEAEHLPFADNTFDVATGLLTVHHWNEREAGLREMARVSRRQVFTVFDTAVAHTLWILDYFPEVRNGPVDTNAPTAASLNKVLHVVDEQALMVPRDLTDGVAAAYWCRPERYLDADVQTSMSSLALLDPADRERGTHRLRADIESGEWRRRYAHIADAEELDGGYRLVTAEGAR